MGRPNKPTALKVLQGTNRKDRINPDEPQPDVVVVEPFDYLSDHAKDIWRNDAPIHLKNGVLTELDLRNFGARCEALSNYILACQKFEEEPEYTVKTISGNIIQNPLLGVMNTTRKAFIKIATEFGESPASRTKVSAAKPDDGGGVWRGY